MFSISLVATLYCLAGLSLTFGLWIAYDWRSARVWREQRRRRVYHCLKCEALYQAPAAQTAAPCPHCGFENVHLRF